MTRPSGAVRTLLAVLAAACAGALAACGDDDGQATTAAPPPAGPTTGEPAPVTVTAPTVGTGPARASGEDIVLRYRADAAAFSSAFEDLGTSLGDEGPLDIDLARLEAIRSRMQGAVNSMGTYTVPDAQDEARRQVITGAAPALIAALQTLIDARATGDEGAVTRAAQALAAAAGQFAVALAG